MSDASLLTDEDLDALRRFDTFTRGTNARAWLFTILHRGFLDACRRRAAERRVDSLDEVDVAAPETAEVPVWTSGIPPPSGMTISRDRSNVIGLVVCCCGPMMTVTVASQRPERSVSSLPFPTTATSP